MDKKGPQTDVDSSLLDEALGAVEPKKETEDSESEATEDSNKELFDRLVRISADFDNFRKRAQKEKAELLLYGSDKLAADLLPVMDNFERAMEHANETADVDAVREGVEMILGQIKNVLEQHGIRSESALGKPFDPLIHEAVSHEPSDRYPAQTVISEHQKAYFHHKRLLRPALVVVSKGSENSEDKSEQTDEGTDE